MPTAVSMATPTWRRSGRCAKASGCWSCSTGRPSPSRITRCKCSGRLFDLVLARRGERITVLGATSGDTGSAAIDACRDREAIDIFVLHPKGQSLRGAAPADDDRHLRKRPQHRHRRDVRRLSGPGEGAVRGCRLSPPLPARRRQLDQLGADRRADRLLRARGAGARRARPRGGVRGADRQFRQRLRRLCCSAAGGADRETRSSAPIATTF